MLHFRGRNGLGQPETFEWGIFVSEWRYARAKGNPETAGQAFLAWPLRSAEEAEEGIAQQVNGSGGGDQGEHGAV
jgi:hypothetical protein